MTILQIILNWDSFKQTGSIYNSIWWLTYGECKWILVNKGRRKKKEEEEEKKKNKKRMNKKKIIMKIKEEKEKQQHQRSRRSFCKEMRF